MNTLSINFPDDLVEASQRAAEELGISRTQFIRQAVVHELKNYRKQRELKAMATAFAAMNKHPEYLKESKEIEENLNTLLPEEADQWWTGKS